MKTLEVHEKSTGTKFGLKERAELSVNHAFSPATRSYPSRRWLSVHGRVGRYETKGGPAARLTKRIGSTYTASCYVNLYSLLCSIEEGQMKGKRISVFSYGSGSASTMYHLEVRGSVKMDRTVFDRLSTRQPITVRPTPRTQTCPLCVRLSVLSRFRALSRWMVATAGGSVPQARGRLLRDVRQERLEGTEPAGGAARGGRRGIPEEGRAGVDR